MTPKAVAIVGYKNSGKTQVVEAITRELTKRGYHVATIKHTAETTILDTPGKDTKRHRLAGAQTTAILHNKGAAIFHQNPQTIQQTAKTLGTPDYIILEGFKTQNYIPRILVPITNKETTQLTNGLEIAIARLEHRQLTHSIPIIDITDPQELTNIVQAKAFSLLPGNNCNACGHINCSEMAKALLKGESTIDQCVGYSTGGVNIKVDGKLVPLTKFTKDITRNIINGILKSLKGVNQEGKIELVIEDE